ncbi:hypothetical protein [Polaribacter sp. IC073]|uniref:hypothetical protein n=1 Tax=Polaribacter sp. IC073 TaxID=2508540 RepID=UPI0011BDA558|nr:hypothetical protein [Polaribacter sp. IC073]TXD47620.1 hypothetical protein ES045_10015 [Polaribacter sp. IC073]
MKTSTFIHLLERKTEIQHLETAELKAIIAEFPYFQAARVLYLKGLKSQDSFKYNNELKATAAHTKDRTVLFTYITSFKADVTIEENIHQQILEKISSEKPVEIPSISATEITPKIEETAKAEESLEIGKPLSFSSSENHSFHQWLQLSTKEPIVREEEKRVKKIKEKPEGKENLIDKFIQNNPKITPLEKGKEFAVPVSKNRQDAALMTETLAKVYLAQKKYENAMQAYRILSLKYPEKSGFFADQIKRIQILQKNKS